MNNLSLYEISTQYREALTVLTDPEMELSTEVVLNTLDGLQGELEEKAINVAKFMKNMETTALAIRQAETQMAKRRRAIENRADWLKIYLKGNMEACGINQIDSPWFRLSIQNNPPSVNIIDENLVPPEFKEEVKTLKINKIVIKERLKAGETIQGANLTQSKRLVVR